MQTLAFARLLCLVQVFVNGELLGGSSETLDLLKNGKLHDMLQSAKEDPLPKDLRDLVQNTKSETEVHQSPESDRLVWSPRLHAKPS